MPRGSAAAPAQTRRKTVSRRLTPDDIVHEIVDIDSIRPHPQNPRNSNEEVLDESIEEHGVFRSVVLSEDGYLLCGNHTWKRAREKGETRIWVGRLPLKHTDPQAVKIMLVDNRSADLAARLYDDTLLGEMLKEFEGDLQGTGYDDKILKRFLASVDSTPIEVQETFSVLITCDSENHQRELLERFAEEGLECKALVT